MGLIVTVLALAIHPGLGTAVLVFTIGYYIGKRVGESED